MELGLGPELWAGPSSSSVPSVSGVTDHSSLSRPSGMEHLQQGPVPGRPAGVETLTLKGLVSKTPAPVVTPKGWGCSCVSRPQPSARQGRVTADSPPGPKCRRGLSLGAGGDGGWLLEALGAKVCPDRGTRLASTWTHLVRVPSGREAACVCSLGSRGRACEPGPGDRSPEAGPAHLSAPDAQRCQEDLL